MTITKPIRSPVADTEVLYSPSRLPCLRRVSEPHQGFVGYSEQRRTIAVVMRGSVNGALTTPTIEQQEAC